MSPFTPLGETARWRILYGVLQDTAVGSVAPYNQLAQALSVHPVRDRRTIQAAMSRAARELEEVDKHAVEAVANIGYRVVEASENLRLARGHQRKSVLALRRGKSKLVNIDPVDFSKLPAAMQTLVHNALVLVTEQQDFNRRTDIRQKNLEAAMASVQQKSSATEDQVAALTRRLATLEQKGD